MSCHIELSGAVQAWQKMIAFTRLLLLSFSAFSIFLLETLFKYQDLNLFPKVFVIYSPLLCDAGSKHLPTVTDSLYWVEHCIISFRSPNIRDGDEKGKFSIYFYCSFLYS
ncbi:hypothetical protein VNO77_22388 [Canavalia gladiata]|uniref:Uncharacterized protein n=1 Tax=Canavalia gladiata TaxID=3824 RepID=A0AAN9L2H8_CANGL